ncbi:uroporphyrinogen-III C-methyltransferase [Vibrio sp.]|uniref:Heme biosynthesis operon protein HemX n=1 Tax=Vibrio viridaestus TaxID=2487322 RepID=A0A3N9TBB9_9VIBR|nr:uroporphyrinogen-III C-methyltransferase [Vibrio viridaestus]MDC0611205.1 uroporphyrinogen-III C-methyltransferase [Vibrio sp.]RQW61468.1 heme biosynthesis operon protein HemX [Vibrio viridaestus]
MTTNNTTPETNNKDQKHPQEDATKNQTSTTTEQSPLAAEYQQLQKQSKKGVKLASLAIVISIILSGGIVAYTQQHYQSQISSLQSELQQTQQQLKQQLDASLKQAQSIADNAVNKTETEVAQQHKSIESLQLALAEVKGRRPNDWLLAESDYLVKLAGRKLFLEHDPESATQLMESADQRIAALNDPSLVPLRKLMAEDITTLKAIPLIDKDGLVLRLTSLSQQVDQLPLANAILPEAVEQKKEEVTGDVNNWRTNLLTSAKNFADKFITFRTRDGNAIPLLSPEQHFFLRENLKMKIETAIKAVYDEQQEIYTTSLETANKWSTSYLNQSDNGVAEFNKALLSLSKQNIEVTYPVKLKSQTQLTDVISQRLRRQVTSLIKEDKE